MMSSSGKTIYSNLYRGLSLWIMELSWYVQSSGFRPYCNHSVILALFLGISSCLISQITAAEKMVKEYHGLFALLGK